MTRIRAFGLATGCFAIIAMVGCQDSAKQGTGEEAPNPGEPAEHLVPGPARSVELIAERAVLGFRAEGGSFRAGYDTHDALVRDGIVELTPIQRGVAGSGLAIETGAIRRDDGTVLSGASTTRGTAEGAVEIARGGAVEVVTNREDGVEQAWRFASAPAGTGDLVVEVEVTGHQFLKSTSTGLHFKGADGLGFRYSHAIWIDASGKEWPIQAAWQDNHIAIAVPGDILAETQFPAILDPTISAEADVDAPIFSYTGANSQQPAVAFDGANYLVVWADQRMSRDDDIFAARVTPSGQILDVEGIKVAAVAGKQLHPTVVFAGSQYLVAWEDFKVAGGTQADIAAARVSTDGAVTLLGTVAATSVSETTPKLAADGANALLVWNANGDIRASRFNGTAFGGAINITADALAQSGPIAIARPGGNYLVAYSEGDTATADLRGQFVTAAGALSGAAFTISAGAGRQYDPSGAYDGTNYVVAWTNNNVGINLYGARVDAAGTVLDTRTEGTATVGGVVISNAANNQELSSVACKTGACIAIWQDGRNSATASSDIYAQRLTTTAGLVADGTDIAVAATTGGQFVPAVATNGTDFFATWHDARDVSTQTVFGGRITAAGATSDGNGIVLVLGRNREATPAIGRAGTTFGVFWNDSRAYGTEIELVRFSGASKLDATARTVSSAPFSQSSPAATASNGNFFVVWQDGRGGVDRDIYGARVTSGGAVSDSNGIAIATAKGDQLVPRIATNGTVSLVAWQDRRNGNFDIYGALVDNATGAVSVRDLVIANAAGDQVRPAVAFDATKNQFLVVWSDTRVSTDSNIYGARVDTTGAVLDANGVAITTNAAGQFTPSVAFVGTSALVAWEDRRNDSQGDIYGARVSLGTALTVLDPNGVSISGDISGAQTVPSVSSLSGSFLVAWTDGRNANTSGTDIFGQQVGTNGSLSGAAFAISNNPEDEDAPVLSDSTSNVTRIAYTRVRPDLRTMRVETRTIQASTGTGQTCSSDAQCSTGFCVDSRCCDSACGGNNKSDCQACAHSFTNGADGTCAFIPSTTICRNYANTTCDLREYCTGVSADCPADVGRNQGQVCNSTTGAVCPSNAAPGPHGCP